ncbi:MAG: RDD family protein [Desulfobacterota bacterium]|nr:RDD family protein [Thermodesulfobacteriota bacterium]
MTDNFFAPNSRFNQEYPRIWSITHNPEMLTETVVKAGFWVRGIAYLIDQVIISCIGLIFFVVSLLALKTSFYFQPDGPYLKQLIFLFILTCFARLMVEVAYFIYFYSRTGQTIGKMVCGLKVIGTEGEIISARRAFFRWLGYVISFYTFFLGFFWIVIDPNKQGWHDKIAKTLVIRV